MMIETATATEMQNNFGRYLSMVMSGQEIIVTKNGKEVGRFIPKDATVSYLTDSLSLEISVSGIPSSVFSRMARTSSLEGLTLLEADFISAVSASASVCCCITVSGTPVWDSGK